MLFTTKKHVDISGIIPSVALCKSQEFWINKLIHTTHEIYYQNLNSCKANLR